MSQLISVELHQKAIISVSLDVVLSWVGLGFKQSQSPPHVICSCPRAAVYPSTAE
jgi:hypothetical protein